MPTAVMTVPLPFQPLVNLKRRLRHQEQSAADQDEVPAGDATPGDGEARCCQPDDPRDRQEQRDPHHHRADQADAPRTRPIVLGQLGGQNRNEDA
jgi:hypothetical protein